MVYEARAEEGDVSGKWNLSAEEWDRVEIGAVITVWYATKDPSVSQKEPPRKADVEDAKFGLQALLFVVAVIAIVAWMVLSYLQSEERKLAVSGVPVLGQFQLRNVLNGKRPSYEVDWIFVDNRGNERKVMLVRQGSIDRFGNMLTGEEIVIFHPDEWTNMKPWREFRWVDIVVD